MPSTTAMAAGVRPVSFLPSIKCSTCGNEIEIAAMGDHICAPPSKSQPASFLPQQSHGAHIPPGKNSTFLVPRIQQPPPPRTYKSVPGASNHPSVTAMVPAGLKDGHNNNGLPTPTPISQQSQSVFPVSSLRSNSRPLPLRTATDSTFRGLDVGHEDTGFTPNLDCAFPPFPTPGISTGGGSSASSGRFPRTPSERAPSRGNSRPPSRRADHGHTHVQTSRMQNPPMNQRRPSLPSINFSRQPPSIPTEPIPQSTITQQSRSQDNAQPAKPQPREDRAASLRRPSLPNLKARNAPPPIPTEPLPPSALYGQLSQARRPSTSHSTTSHLQPATYKNDVAIGTLRSQQGRWPGPRLFANSQERANTALKLEPPIAPLDTRNGPNCLHSASRMPAPRQDERHSSTGSGSSVHSSVPSMGNSSTSYGPSPTGSAGSNDDALQFANHTWHQLSDDRCVHVPALAAKGSSEKPGIRAEQPSRRKAAKPYPRPPPALPTQSNSTKMPMAFDSTLELLPDTIHVQDYWTCPRPSNVNQDGVVPSALQIAPLSITTSRSAEAAPYQDMVPPPLQNIPSRLKSAGLHYRPHSPQDIDLVFPKPPSCSQTPHAVLPPRTPSALSQRSASVRPSCRACGEKITGKSIKAADGVLTGRWHKGCFCCQSCSRPFSTADFYVLDNLPYCEQHYHEKNGSLCQGCNRGIEGQYLETSSSSAAGMVDKKYHPQCFTCHDCGVVLSEDYFELTGAVYCEWHALAALRGRANATDPHTLLSSESKSLSAERRTTKLMMM